MSGGVRDMTAGGGYPDESGKERSKGEEDPRHPRAGFTSSNFGSILMRVGKIKK